MNNARFLSMFAVVAIHSTQVFLETGDGHLPLVHVLHTPLKFASVAFFVVAGFLAGRCVESGQPMSYLKRRVRRIGAPWALWVSIMVFCLVAEDLLHHRISLAVSREVLTAIVRKSGHTFFLTAFWFVPNLLLSLAVLLLFRRFHGSLRFGGILLSFSLFYAGNVYGAWVPGRHSEAVLGFVFYVWLGAYAFHHQEGLRRWMARVSFARLWMASALAGGLAYLETVVLYGMSSRDPLNSLRLSNQLFSLVAILILYKINFVTWPRFIDVRRDTFGVYLIHSIVLLAIWPCLRSHPLASAVTRLTESTPGLVALWMLTTLATYGISLLLTKLLVAQGRLGWMVGATAPKREAAGSADLATEPARAWPAEPA